MMQTCGAEGETVGSYLVTVRAAFFFCLFIAPFILFLLQEATATPPLADDMSPEEVLHLLFCQSESFCVILFYILCA